MAAGTTGIKSFSSIIPEKLSSMKLNNPTVKLPWYSPSYTYVQLFFSHCAETLFFFFFLMRPLYLCSYLEEPLRECFHQWCAAMVKINIHDGEMLRKPMSSRTYFHRKLSVRRDYLLWHTSHWIHLHVSSASDTSFHVNGKDKSKWGKTLEQKITITLFPLLWCKFLLPCNLIYFTQICIT